VDPAVKQASTDQAMCLLDYCLTASTSCKHVHAAAEHAKHDPAPTCPLKGQLIFVLLLLLLLPALPAVPSQLRMLPLLLCCGTPI
jgi:hypothetical protein